MVEEYLEKYYSLETKLDTVLKCEMLIINN